MMIRIITIIILSIGLLLGCNRSNPKPTSSPGWQLKNEIEPEGSEYTYTNLKATKEILKDIYESEEFDTFGNIVWRAPKIDFPEIPLSYTNRYHTSMDTTMYFIDDDDDSCAVVILANYDIQLQDGKAYIAGGHFVPVSLGVALLVKRNEIWKLFKIKKHLTSLGYFGIYRTGRKDAGKISLKKFGNRWTCLSFRQGIGGNMGEFWGYERIFSIEKELPDGKITEDMTGRLIIDDYEPLRQIFSYCYHHNYYHPDLDNQTSIDISLNTLPSSGEIYNLQLTIDEMNYHIETDRINSKKKSIREYAFSPSQNIYVETKP